MKSIFAREQGVTLMEMMIVVVVIGIMAAMAVPNLDQAIKDIKFKNVGRELSSKLRLARSASLSLQTPHGIYVDPSAHTLVVFRDIVNPSNYTYESGDSVISVDTVSSQVSFMSTSLNNQVVIFDPDGSASSSGDIYCSFECGGSGTYASFSLWVTAATGRTRLEIYDY